MLLFMLTCLGAARRACRRPAHRLFLAVAAALLLLSFSAGGTRAQNRDLVRADEDVTKRVALVIGNTNYEYKPLKNPSNDARAMADTLTRLGFKVTLRTDLTLAQLRETVNTWADSLDNHTLAMVYYSGHGVTNNGQNYLVPVNNALITHKRDVPDMAYPFQRVLDATKEAGCPLRIFILDACRNDPLPKGLKGDDGQNGLAKVPTPTGSFIAYSAAYGETASDDGGANGLYTAALLKYLPTPGLPIEALFKRVRGAVLKDSRGEQHPDESSQLVGDFCFAGVLDSGNNGSNGGTAAAAAVAAPATGGTTTAAPTPATLPGGRKTADEYIGRGDALWDAEKFDDAVVEYTLAIAADSQNAEAYFDRGSAYIHLDQSEKALADLTEAIRLKPDYAYAYANRGTVYSDLKQYDKAVQDLTEAIRLKPDFAMAYKTRGSAYDDLEKYDQAIADFTKAIQLKPDYPAAFYMRGLVYRSQKQNAKAIADYTEAIRLKPDYTFAYTSRGIVYYGQDLYDKAIADFTKTIQIKPNHTAYYFRALAYSNLKQHSKAVADYTQAIALQPDDESTYSSRGISYDDLKQYDKAIADYTKAIQLKPDYANAYYFRGYSYYNTKQYSKAVADLRKYLELVPTADDAAQVRNRIAEIIKEMN